MTKFGTRWRHAPKKRPALVALGLALLMLASACGGDAGSGDSKKVTVVGYGGPTPEKWKQYIFEPFEKDSGISTSWVVAPGGIVAGVAAQQESGNVQWDAGTALAGSDVAQLAEEGYLEKLPAAVTATTAGLPDATDYYTPFAYGASVIVCNKKAVKACPTDAEEFFDTKNFPGKRMFFAFQPLTALAFAAEANGVAPTDIWSQDLSSMTDKLDSIRGSVSTFYNSGDEAKRLLESGEVPIGLYASGNLRAMIGDSGESDTITWSWEDAIKFGLYNAVIKGGPNSAGAAKLFEYLAENPEVQAAELGAEGYAPAAKGVIDLLPAELQEWIPDSEGKTGLAIEDNEWYLSNKDAVDGFWKTFTGS